MMKRIRELIQKNRDILLYLVFGVLTTLVNYIVYFPCCYVGIPASVSNILVVTAMNGITKTTSSTIVVVATLPNRLWT